MHDIDDPSVRKRVAAQFGQGIFFTSDDIVTMIQTYSTFQLALIVATYHEEAAAFLLDANGTWQCLIGLLRAITRHLSDGTAFETSVKAVLEGVATHDDAILDRLPTFTYVPRGNRIGIHITFPNE